MRRLAGFDWDSANTKKCQSHGVTVEDIEYLFRNIPAVYPDVGHSHTEKRNLAFGTNALGRNLLVVVTYRECDGKLCIRAISARYMHKKEVKRYKEL